MGALADARMQSQDNFNELLLVADVLAGARTLNRGIFKLLGALLGVRMLSQGILHEFLEAFVQLLMASFFVLKWKLRSIVSCKNSAASLSTSPMLLS